MLNEQIAQKVMAKISLRHQNAITLANKNTSIAEMIIKTFISCLL